MCTHNYKAKEPARVFWKNITFHFSKCLTSNLRVMAHWSSPLWDPATSKTPWGVCRWNSCWPFANELDLGVPTACEVRSAFYCASIKTHMHKKLSPIQFFPHDTWWRVSARDLLGITRKNEKNENFINFTLCNAMAVTKIKPTLTPPHMGPYSSNAHGLKHYYPTCKAHHHLECTHYSCPS